MNNEDALPRDNGSLNSVLRLDWLLRFDAQVAERYERERGADRITELRHLTYVGLILYNAYNFSAIFLVPDILLLAVVSRVMIVTPASLLLCWMIDKVNSSVREVIVAIGMANAFAIPTFLFWFTDAPLGSYIFGELPLILVYGNMLLLRFQGAIFFTTIAFAMSVAAALTKIGLTDGLRAAFVLQAITAGVWTLYANYRSEALRCRAYLEELRAILHAEVAEASSSRFLDLSLTDALTSLPNRRHLDQTLEHWSREQVVITIIMIDVDYFKLFNDALGHPAGDECLRSIGSALASALAGTEHFAARFGGEEFTVAARDLESLRAARLAKTLVEAIEALSITHPGRSDGCGVVTISAGIAVKPIEMALKTGFDVADAALYEAKRRGRNRYVLAGSATYASENLVPVIVSNAN